MRRMAMACVLVAVAVLGVGVPTAEAGPADAPTVTLHADPTSLVYGQDVRFSGQVSPASNGQTVQVLDQDGNVLAEATTDAQGNYETSASAKRNATVHAQWGAVPSDTVGLHVRARLAAAKTPFRLFDTTRVTGRVTPANAGRRISVGLYRAGKRVAHEAPALGPKGAFHARFPIEHPGTYRAIVTFRSADFSRTTWRSHATATPLPALHQGSRGVFVKLLEQRLLALHYRVFATDGEFDYHVADSVMAFHKAQGAPRTTDVDTATWYALANPKLPVARDRSKGYHWEVDLTKQLLYYVKDGSIVDILHVSTGKPSTPTIPGRFHVRLKTTGFNSKGMYYSSYFDGNRALHGYVDVPSYAASHGCVRIPYWNAIWTYDRAPYGMLVWVY